MENTIKAEVLQELKEKDYLTQEEMEDAFEEILGFKFSSI